MKKQLTGIAGVALSAALAMTALPANAATATAPTSTFAKAVSPGASQAQAAARPGRRDGKTRPVILVHGWNRHANTNCRNDRSNARKMLRKHKWKAKSYTFGYYKGGKSCNMKYKGTTDTRIMEVGRQLAWRIYKHWSRKGKAVDVMAHSMGGLVTKAAIQGVNRYGKTSRKWPNYLYVEDVVTLGTPHKGSGSALGCAMTHEQCSDMRGGSGFLSWLDDKGSKGIPQSQMGTDYTFMSSKGDSHVSFQSGTNMRHTPHWVHYGSKAGSVGKNISHSGLRTTYTSKWNCEYQNRTGGIKTGRVTSPLVHGLAAMYRARKY